MLACAIQCAMSQYWFAFSTDENSETRESSAIYDGWPMLPMFFIVLYVAVDYEI